MTTLAITLLLASLLIIGVLRVYRESQNEIPAAEQEIESPVQQRRFLKFFLNHRRRLSSKILRTKKKKEKKNPAQKESAPAKKTPVKKTETKKVPAKKTPSKK
jgi:hypothetical protein